MTSRLCAISPPTTLATAVLGSLYCSNGTANVGGGVEYPSSGSGFSPVSIDIGDDQSVVDTHGSGWDGAAFNGFILSTLEVDFAGQSGGLR